MIRKLILPALAALVLAGCASYQYRGGAGGDYYYGQPTTEYRYYGSPYGAYGYGYPSGWGGSIGYGSYYGSGYYGNPYYRNPYYRHYGYPRYPRPPHNGHGDGSGSNPGSGQSGQHADRPRWRDLDRLRERAGTRTNEQRTAPLLRSQPVAPAPMQQRSAPVRRTAPTTAPRQRRAKRDTGLTP